MTERPVAVPQSEGPLRVRLASSSPRRRALLTDLGWDLEVLSPDVDESRRPGEGPAELCERLARLKATACAADGDLPVVAADTVVAIDGLVLGKPADRRGACAMLRRLQGRTHEVMTGLAVFWRGRLLSCVERTSVTFRPLSEEAVCAYAASGEGDDKAGAYAIQGLGGLLVSGIRGDYFNVVGLPLCRLGQMMESLGLGLSGMLGGGWADVCVEKRSPVPEGEVEV